MSYTLAGGRGAFLPLVRPYRSHRWRVRPETLSTKRCWQCDRVRISKDEPDCPPKRCAARLPRARALCRPAQWPAQHMQEHTRRRGVEGVRKTREAAGYVEWAVFHRDWRQHRNTETAPCMIQASGAYRTAPGPTVGQDWHLARLSSGRGDEVVLIQTYPEMRADAFHPLQNRWRELAPPSRPSEWFGDGIGQWATCSRPWQYHHGDWWRC